MKCIGMRNNTFKLIVQYMSNLIHTETEKRPPNILTSKPKCPAVEEWIKKMWYVQWNVIQP